MSDKIIIDDINKLKELAKLNNPYNTYVRALLSEQWNKALNEKSELMKQIEEDALFFSSKEIKKSISYYEYSNRKIKAERRIELMRDKQIEIDTWSKAMEICMSAIDDLGLSK